MKKVLCFTTSYLRPKMLRGCIFDIQNQTNKNIFHAINIAYDNGNKMFIDGQMECSKYRFVFDDISRDKLSIVYNMNEHQQINYTNALKSVNLDDFDLFVKIMLRT